MRTGIRANHVRHGFTLIELSIVVLILAISSALVIPELSSNDDTRCRAAARTMLADFHFAQNRAIALHKSHYIRFTGQQYILSDQMNLVAMDHPLDPVTNDGKFIMTFGTGGQSSLVGCSLGAISIEGAATPVGATDILGFNDQGEPFAFDGTSETPLTVAATIIVQSGSSSLSIQIEPITGDITIQ